MVKRLADPEVVLRDLTRLAEVAHADEIRLAGGEPLLHPRILDVVEAVRASGIADTVTLISNGTLLERAPAGLWERLDRLWISVYPDTNPRLDAVEGIERAGVKVWHKGTGEFRVTFLNRENTDRKLVRSLYRECRMAHDWACNLIHNGRFYKCVVAPFVADRLRLIGITIDNHDSDSVSLHDQPDLGAALRTYLGSTEPLQACTYCLGTCGKSMRHTLLDKAGLHGELTEDHSDLRSLLSRRARVVGEISYRLAGNRMLHGLKWWLRFRQSKARNGSTAES